MIFKHSKVYCTRVFVRVCMRKWSIEKPTLPMNSNSSLLASPLAAGAATVTRTSSALTPDEKY